jgi:hypothetical protein
MRPAAAQSERFQKREQGVVRLEADPGLPRLYSQVIRDQHVSCRRLPFKRRLGNTKSSVEGLFAPSKKMRRLQRMHGHRSPSMLLTWVGRSVGRRRLAAPG